MVQSCDKIGGMEAIGGYPALELRQGEHYHTGALKLNTARNALEYILRVRGYDKVYIPIIPAMLSLNLSRSWACHMSFIISTDFSNRNRK